VVESIEVHGWSQVLPEPEAEPPLGREIKREREHTHVTRAEEL